MKHLKKQIGRNPMAPMNAAARRLWMNQLQQDIAAYDWRLQDEACVETFHPDSYRRWLQYGPCKGCPCEAWCDKACRLRLKWWDDSMAVLRRSLGASG